MAMVGCPTENLSVAEDPSVRDGGCESNKIPSNASEISPYLMFFFYYILMLLLQF